MPAIASAVVAAALAATSVTYSAANSVATGDQDTPSIATNRSGRVAVVWEDDRDAAEPGDDTHSEIYLRLFTNGTPGYELKLSGGGTSGTGWRHITPDVGLDDRGNAVVVWADDPDGNGYFNVPYRVVSPTGVVLASGRANANTAGDQRVPRVAVDPDGTPGNAAAVAFTVVWQDVQGAAVTVRAAGYTGSTTKAYEVRASPSTGTHRLPDVAVGASGDAAIAWQDDDAAGGSDDIGLTRLAKANGAVLLSPRHANVNTGGRQLRPAIAANFAGDLVLAWESDHTGAAGVWARSLTATGAGRHPEVQVSTTAGAAAPTVGLDDRAAAVVGWTVSGADGWLRGLNPDGTFAGRLAAQALTSTTTGRQDQYAVAVSAWGEVPVAYTDDSDGNSFDQVLLGVGATNGDWLAGTSADASRM